VSKVGRVVEVCISARKGVPKRPVRRARLLEEHGLLGDAHAGPGERQVSLLCEASAEKLRDSGLELRPGIFAENLRVAGLCAADFRPGALLRLERGPVLRVTRIGKECHSGCAIARQVGRCVMPAEGIFAQVLRGGEVAAGDGLEVVNDAAQGSGACDQ